MSTTQQHLLISDIQDGIVLLKNGGGALVMQVSAVNFGLLSDREQMAIIYSFAQMLNSLSFSIQILIYSTRLNISSYLNLLDQAQKVQVNPLLSKMIGSYKQFIQTTIKEQEVLDKRFFLVIPLFSLEVGLAAAKSALEQKIKTVLLPRRDQVIRQLQRIGLKATQLTGQKLVELLFDIYNGQFVENVVIQPKQQPIEVDLKQPTLKTDQPTFKTAAENQPALLQTAAPSQPGPVSRNHPFVVEELAG